ncbi:bifunctional DNA primase/polymerase [Massilia sp. P8910]|uniref:bifunctional DNA primase/polymerase n=1 Tax=Massilia antarctica TaxID=2765360 RepID=UPI001E3CF83C|nr:bifunctional DNA primase/polymerase [Massilia antarctica]MCE3602617.1 bifunctional DNA primase/polymerase [Massilia antarctica]
MSASIKLAEPSTNVHPTLTPRATALACAAGGFPVFPFHGVTDGKCDCGQDHAKKDVGNHPCFGRSTVSATTDPALINEWFDERPNINFAVAAGREIGVSGKKMLIIEAGRDEATKTATQAALQKSAVPHSVLAEAITADGTLHIYISVEVSISAERFNLQNGPFKMVPFALGPASVQHSGAKVEWLRAPFRTLPLRVTPDAAPKACDRSDEKSASRKQSLQPARDDNIAVEIKQSKLGNDDTLTARASAVTNALARVEKVRAFSMSYTEQGFKLCRIENGGKAPKYASWQKAPIDPLTVGDHGLGLIHTLSGTCAIDLDDLTNAEGWFAAKGLDLHDLLHTDDAVQIKSGRANRAKLLYRLPVGLISLDTVKIKNGDGSMMVEFRCASDGGSGIQDVLPPTVHPDTGRPYEWAGAGDYQSLPSLPASLLALWQSLSTTEMRANSPRTAARGTIAEGGRNDTLFKLGGDLASLKLPIETIEAALLLENSNRCAPPLPVAEVRAIARSASTGSRGAKAAADAETAAAEQAALLTHATGVVANALSKNTPQHDALGARLPEVMTAIIEWCNANARTVQPAFALCTALASCSGVLARDFTGAAGAHTNLYNVAIGPTACGKENALRTVAQIITAYDATRLAGVPASDGGVLAAMKRNPASVFVIDEIGEVLKSIFDVKAASYKALIGTTFMELYTKGGQAYRGKEYAQQTGASGRPREDIYSPNPSILGATTATTFYDGMNSAAINSGFLPRMMVFRAPDTIPLPNTAYAPSAIPELVTTWLGAVSARVAQHRHAIKEKGDLISVASDQYLPIDVPYSDAAKALFSAEQIKIVHRRNAGIDTLESNMLSRTVENAGRVALTLALAKDPWALEVSAECFIDAMGIVNQSNSAFIADIRANLFDSTHAKLESKVLEKITQYFANKNGKPITDGILVDHCKPYGAAKPQDRKGVVEALVHQGKITVTQGRNAGSVRYFPHYVAE